MPTNKLLTRFFASGLQALAVQVLGSLFFYLISVYLAKDNFGMISWLNAMSLFITTLLGFGLEQVVTRRIAASDRSDWAAAAFLFHSIAGFVITVAVMLGLQAFIHNNVFKYLPWFFIAQGIGFMGIPLKQFLNAKERFTPYGIIAIISNGFKIVAAWLLQREGGLNTYTVIITLIIASVFELITLLIYVTAKTTFSFKIHLKAYYKLVKESAAQYLSVIFDMSLSRIDWILLGFMTTNAVLADYSFAYRSYELARLPMLIIGPMILPRFSRLLASAKPPEDMEAQVNAFNTVELFFAMLIPLVLNILWSPVVGWLTGNKYGLGNSIQFLILSFCIPLQFFINLLWTISFSARKYKWVSGITITCALGNIILNLILIPRFGGTGAAVAFLVTTLLQALLYYRLVNKQVMMVSIMPVAMFGLLAVGIYVLIGCLHLHYIVGMVLAIFVYTIIAAVTRLISKQRLMAFKNFLS